MPKPSTDVLNAIMENYNNLVVRYTYATEQIAYFQNQQKTMMAENADFQAVARVFEFDLTEQWQIWKAAQAIGPKPQIAEPAPAAIEQMPDLTVKDLILIAAREAHPDPVLAATLRDALQKRGLAVHEKTVGMTLYRLSRENKVRREGRKWFFVPDSERAVDKENPASGAGSF